MRIKRIILPTASKLIQKKGLDKNGHVQMFHTNNVNRRIGKYMPYRAPALSTKLKHIRSGTEIEVLAPYAKYQYHGKVMVGPAPKVVTDKPLDYSGSKVKHQRAGPYWDRALVAAEGRAMTADLQRYIDKRR